MTNSTREAKLEEDCELKVTALCQLLSDIAFTPDLILTTMVTATS